MKFLFFKVKRNFLGNRIGKPTVISYFQSSTPHGDYMLIVKHPFDFIYYNRFTLQCQAFFQDLHAHGYLNWGCADRLDCRPLFPLPCKYII